MLARNVAVFGFAWCALTYLLAPAYAEESTQPATGQEVEIVPENSTSPANGVKGIIKVQSSKRCLNVPGATTAEGAQIIQWDCDWQPHMLFRIDRVPDTGSRIYYTIKPSHDDTLCLDVAQASDQPKAAVIQYKCHNADNQKFYATRADAGGYNLHSVSSKLCLDIEGASVANGAKLIQFTCNRGDNQRFVWLVPPK